MNDNEAVHQAVKDSPAAMFAAASGVPVTLDPTMPSQGNVYGNPFEAIAVLRRPGGIKEASGALAEIAIPFVSKAMRDQLAKRALFDGQQMLDLISDPQRFASASGDRFSIITRRACWTMNRLLADEHADSYAGFKKLDLPPDDRNSPFTREEARDAFHEVVWAASRIGICGMKNVDKPSKEGMEAAIRYLAFATHYAVAVERKLAPEKLDAFANACAAQFCRGWAQNPVIDAPRGFLNERGRAVVAFFGAATKSVESMKQALPAALKMVAEAAKKAGVENLESLHGDMQAWSVPSAPNHKVWLVGAAAAEGLHRHLETSLDSEADDVRRRVISVLAEQVGADRAETVMQMAAKEFQRCAAMGRGPCPAIKADIERARQLVAQMPGFCRHVLHAAEAEKLAPEHPTYAVGEHRQALAEVVQLAGQMDIPEVEGASVYMEAFALADAMVDGPSELAEIGLTEAKVGLAVTAAKQGIGAVASHPAAKTLVETLERGRAEGSILPDSLSSRSITDIAMAVRSGRHKHAIEIDLGADGLPVFNVGRGFGR